jgi:hypothetical protein
MRGGQGDYLRLRRGYYKETHGALGAKVYAVAFP